jgi:3-hydroxyisobutyrate dehydrogenase-like beta-hydroxyacid dehydrogenase
VGRTEMAASRHISLSAAGDRSTYVRCLAVPDGISRNVLLVSETPWHANLLKLSGDFLLLSGVKALAEIFAVLPTQLVDPSLLLDADSSWRALYQSFGRRMISGEFLWSGFKLGLARKDNSLLSKILTDDTNTYLIIELKPVWAWFSSADEGLRLLPVLTGSAKVDRLEFDELGTLEDGVVRDSLAHD